MAVKIDLIADVKDVIKGTDKIGDALESVADDLKDVGKEGERIDDKVSDAFRNMGKDAADAGRKIGKEVKDGTDKAGEGLEELKGESQSTAREAAASFGSIEDAADALQEVVANAFGGFGPAGMAAGIVAAAGIGLAISAAQEHADKINENKELVSAMAQTIRDNGGVLTEEDYIKNMEDYGYAIQDTKEFWEIFQADAVTGFEELRGLAKETGVSTKDIFRGAFGSKEQATRVLDEVNKKLTELRESTETIYTMDGQLVRPVDQGAIDSLEKTKTKIEENIQAQEDAALVDSIRKDGVDSLTDSIADNREELKTAAEAQSEAADKERELAQYVQGTTEHYRAQADAIEEATDALKGSITTEFDYLDSVDELSKKLADNSNAWDINTAKGRENQRAVVDVASGIEEMAKASLDAGAPVADVTAKFQAQKDALVTQVMPAFDGSREKAQLYIDTILKTPPVTRTKVELDTEAAERALADMRARAAAAGIPIQILPDGTAVERYIMSQQGRKIFIDVAPRGGGQAIALP